MSKDTTWVTYDGRAGRSVKVTDMGEFTAGEPREIRNTAIPLLRKSGGMFHESPTAKAPKPPETKETAAKKTTKKV